MTVFDRVRGLYNRLTQSYWPNRATRIVYVQSTIASVRVSPDTALQQATVWACKSILEKSIAQLPWRAMQEVDEDESRIVPGKLDDLLNHRPNPEMSAFTFRETMMGHALIWGNAFAEIERDTAGRPVALWPIEPDRVFVKRDWQTSRLYYQVNNQTKGLVDLNFMDMFHIHGPSFDGVTGYQTIGYAAQSIGLALAVERFGAAFFGNNAQLGGVITNAKSNLNADGRSAMLASFNEKHQGSDRAFKWNYLDGGMKAETIGVAPEQGQFIQTQQNQVEVICRWFGVPPHKVQHLLRSTNNNIEHQGIEFVTDGILPWTVRFEQEANFKLINQRNPQGYYSRIDVRSLQRGDLAARSAFYMAMFDRGAFSPNDILHSEGMNPIPDGEGGNKHFVMVNMQTLDSAGATPAAPAAGGTSEADPAADDDPDTSEGGSETTESDTSPGARRLMMKEKKLTGAYYQMKAAGATGEIVLYSDIGDPYGDGQGTSAEGFRNDLKALGKVSTIDVRINSPGGNVFEGFAIYGMLKSHSAKIVCWVDGLAASIASVICMAGDEINIADNGMMMIHDAWGVGYGTADEMQKTVDVLRTLTGNIAATYAKRSKAPLAKIEQMMKDESWLTATDAVEAGLADHVNDGMKIAACAFDPKRFRNAPRKLIEAVAALPKRDQFAARFQSLKLDEIRGRMSA